MDTMTLRKNLKTIIAKLYAPTMSDGVGFKKVSRMGTVLDDMKKKAKDERFYYTIEVHQKRMVLAKNPLYIFREDVAPLNEIRAMSVWLVEWKWFERMILFTIMGNLVSMVFPSSYDETQAGDFENNAFEMANLTCIIIFLLEASVKIIARGFVCGDAPDACYLADFSNGIDFFICVMSVVELVILQQDGGGGRSKLVMVRFVRILRPLKRISRWPSLQVIVASLIGAVPRLARWLVTVAFVCLVFALCGESLFGTVYWHRCRLTERPVLNNISGVLEWAPDPAQTRFCGGRYECRPTVDGHQTYCESLVNFEDGIRLGLDDDYVNAELETNPEADYGYTGFQSFSSAFLTVFQIATMEGWTDVLYRFQDGRDSIVALVFVVALVIFSGLILLNLVLGVLWASFDAEIQAAKQKKTEAVEQERFPRDIMQMKLEELVLTVNEITRKNKEKDQRAAYDSSGGGLAVVRSIAFSIVTQPSFDVCMLIIIVINCAVLAIDSHPPLSETVLEIKQRINLLCTFFFTGEAAFKLFSLGFKFFDEYLNIADLVLVISGLVELVLGGSGVVLALRVSRLLRLLKMMSQSVHVSVLLRVTQKASFLTLNFMALVLMVLIGTTIIGLQMFYTKEDISDDDQMQFSSFTQSLIITFALLTGEHWHTIMIDRARSRDDPALVLAFFTAAFIFLHLILMNLFLGMFVAAFSTSRAEVIDNFREVLLNMRATGKDKTALRPVASQMGLFPMGDYGEEEETVAESPVFPKDVWRSYPAGPTKSHANDMNVLRMLQVKKSAGTRAERIVLVPSEEMKEGQTARTKGRPQHAMQDSLAKSGLVSALRGSTTTLSPSTQVATASKSLVTEAVHKCPPPPALGWWESNSGSMDEQWDVDVEKPPAPPACYLQDELHRASPPGSARALGHVPILQPLDLACTRPAQGSRAKSIGQAGSEDLRQRFALKPGGEQLSFRELYRRAREEADHEDSELSTPILAAAADVRTEMPEEVVAAPVMERSCQEELWKMNDDDFEAPASFSICIHPSASHGMAPAEQPTTPGSVMTDVSMKSLPTLADAQLALEAPEGESAAAAAKRRKKQSALKRCCLHLCSSPVFEPTVLVLILISSIALCVDTPYLDPDSKMAQLLGIVEIIVSAAFLFEMLIKMCAFGIRTKRTKDTPPGYFRSAWNLIDFIIVMSSIVDFVAAYASSGSSFLKLIRVMRLLRTLRPLRLITRNKGLKIIVESLICSMPTLARAIAISLLFYVGFGILFMNLMKGELWRCSLDPGGNHRPDIVTKEDCLANGGEWINAKSNFDHFGASMATVLHLGTGEGWLDVLVDVVNSVGVDLQPRRNARLPYALLIILFVWVGSFFLVNLLIGVLTDQYQVTKDIVHGTEMMTPQERKWLGVQARLFGNPNLLKPIWHVGGLFMKSRMLLNTVIDTKFFDCFIVTCICANTILLTIEVPTLDRDTSTTISWVSFVFLIIFNVELCLKLFIQFSMFFNEPWNVFDCVIICMSDCGLIVSRFLPPENPLVALLDSARILRCLRLVRVCTFLRNYCKTMLQLLPALCNVSLLLILLLFIYACLGIGLFGTVAPGEVLGEANNFNSFGNAMLLVLRVSTGEEWQKIMYDVVLDRANCTTTEQTAEELERDGPNGCGTILGYPYFISFTSFVSIVLMNIIIAVILEGFQTMEQIESYEIYLQEVKLAAKAWLRVDYKGRGYLSLEQAATVMAGVPLPVGFQGLPVKKVTHQMRYLPIYDGRVHFRDIVVLSAKRVYCWTNKLPESEACNVHLDDLYFARWCNFYPEVPRPDRGIDSFLVGHLLVKNFIDLRLARLRQGRRIRLAEAYINEQMADAQPLRKGLNKSTANLKQAEAAPAAGGRNAAGLFPSDVCLGVSDQVSSTPRAQSPYGSRPSPLDFEPPADPAMEDTPFGRPGALSALRSSPLPWPPPATSMGIRPQDRLVQADMDTQFAPLEVGLVGSGFDLPSAFV